MEDLRKPNLARVNECAWQGLREARFYDDADPQPESDPLDDADGANAR